LLGVLAYAYRELPASFVPEEDQGSLMVDVQLPAGATFGRTEKAVAEIEDYLSSRDSMKWVTSVMGFSFSGTGENAAILFPDLKDWSERTEDQSVAAETALLNEHFADFKDGAVMAMAPPAIEGLGSSGGFSLRLLDRSGVGRAQMQLALDELLTKANQSPAIAYAMMEGLQDAPNLQLDIDRAKADALGVSFQAISDAVSTAFGSATINDFNNAGRQQRVVVQAQSEQRMTPQSLLQLHIPSRYGTQVPLSSFASIQWQNTPVQLSRYNGYPSFSISGDAKAGASSGDVMTEMEHIVAALPPGIGYEWTGLSYQEKLSGSQVSLLITLSILVVFLVLVALYESWSIPLSVILIVPVGALGSVLTVAVLGLANTVYFKVGLITIIGLSAKNAILIIEFAKELHHQGLTYAQAVLQAARMRFRPIVMTSVAFILGVLPLTIATGPGAASQQALGTSVMGGMISATLLGVILVPVFYVWVMTVFSKQPEADNSVNLKNPN
jgi:multidrug efflux pump